MAKLSKNVLYFKKTIFQSTKIKNKKSVLHALKDDYPISEIKQIIPHIASHPLAKKYIYGSALPKSYGDLRSGPYTYKTTFDKELDWLCISLVKYSCEITDFVRKKTDFEGLVLTGKYKEAVNCLDDINNTVCYSLWGIENRLLVEELQGGLETNKAFLSNLNEESLEVMSSLFAHFYSNRAERKMSSVRYNSMLAEFVRNLSKGFQEYWSIKMNFVNTPEFSEFVEILTYDIKSSVVDRYLTFIRIAQWITLNGTTEQKAAITSRLQMIHSKIGDPLLSNLLNVYLPDHSRTVDENDRLFIEVLDLYTVGNYQNALIKCQELIFKFPQEFPLYDIYIKCLFYLDQGLKFINDDKSLTNEIIEDLYNIYSRNDNTTNSLARLNKSVNLLDSFSVSPQIFSFLQTLNQEKIVNDDKQLLYLNSLFINPLLYKTISKNSRQVNFLQSLNSYFPGSTTVNFYLSHVQQIINKQVDEDQLSIPTDRSKIYAAKVYMNLERYEDAIRTVESLSTTSVNSILQEELLIQLFNCHRALKEYDKCILLFVKLYLSNKYLILRFDLGSIPKDIERAKFKNVDPNIYLPIFFHVTKQDNHSVNVALRVFLRNIGLARPPELVNFKERFEQKVLTELLLEVCTPEILKYSPYFNSTKEILNERLEIYQLLSQINPIDNKIYKMQISRVSQNLAIIEGVREVDESKIYVDEKGLVMNEFAEIHNIFNRYIEISNLIKEKPLFFVDVITNKKFLYKALDINLEPEDIEKARLSKNIKFSLFKELFFEILDKFLFSSQYGLDSYLSTRIRHGTLLGQLRSEFQKQFLITQKDKTSEEYYKNQFWEDHLPLPNYKKDEIQLILADFSRKIDLIASDLKDKHIQIKTEHKKNEGLFDYVFTEPQLLFYFEKFFNNIHRYEEFVTYGFALIWEKTNTNLEIIQNIISVKIKAEIVEHLKILERDLKEAVDDISDIQLLITNITTCRTNIISEIDKIADWFKIRESITSDFKIDKVIDTSIEITKKISQINIINVQSELNSTTLLKGEFFIHFFDIIRIFLENAVSYSQLDPTDLRLVIAANEEDQKLIIKISNNLSANIDTNALSDFFEKRAAKLNEDVWNMEALKTEIGGTGFYKAKKILQTNLLNINNHFTFIIDENKMVRISIVIDLSKIKV